MKLFDIDWADFIARLPAWEQLSLKTRDVLAELRGNETRQASEFDGQDQLLVDAGLLARFTDGQRVRLEKAGGPFVRVIRAMLRHDLLAQSNESAFVAYLSEHFSREEQSALFSEMRSSHGYPAELARKAMSVSWLEDFLAKQGSDSRSIGFQPSWLATSDRPKVALREVQTVLRRFMEWPEPVPFHELPARFPELSAPVLGAAIHEGIRWLLLFPTMRQDDMIPLLGLWPSIAARLHRPKRSPPATVRPQEVFHQAYLMEDMTTVLVAAAAKPIRLRVNDGAIFAKVQQELEAGFLRLPQWMEGIDSSSMPRSDVAVTWLRAFGWIRTMQKDGFWLQPTPQGRRWLAGNAKQRLKDILDRLKEPSAERSQEREDDEDDMDDDEDGFYAPAGLFDENANVEFVPGARFQANGAMIPLQPFLATAFSSLPDKKFVGFTDFVHWQMQEQNPFLKLWSPEERPVLRANWSWQRATVEELENLWGNLLVNFFSLRLLPLGGVRLGVAGKLGSACISLTDIGRYLLGMAEDFDHGLDHDAQSGVIVQPNFDVVFLSPSPLVEATVGRFAERQAKGVGAILKITKKSIMTAAASGMTAAEVLETLERVSAKPLPSNVRREIQGWFDQCRRVNVWSTVLIQCPDADTATRVVAAVGSRAVPISETILELRGSGSDAELLRKLQSLGIFVDRLAPAASLKNGTDKTRRRAGRRSRR